MAEYTKTPLEELQEKLTSAIKDNTRAQAETMKASTATGKEIRRLQKDTARQQKQAAFLEKDLGAELGESLSAPFKTLANIIPKPLRILASMPIQAAMRGLTPAAPRTDPSGTILPSASGTGVFKGALSETMGKEISDKGYYEGIKGMFTGPGGSTTDTLLGELVEESEKQTDLLEVIIKALEPPREASLGKGSGFREGPLEAKSKILDAYGRPLAAAGGFGGVGGGGKGKPPTGDDDDDGMIPDWMKTGATAGVAATGTWAIFRKGLLKFLGKGSLVGSAVVTTAMVIKDIYDLSSSAEERHQKGAENVGSLVGTGLGAGIGAVFGIPGMMVGAMLGNVIGEMIGKTIDAEKNPHIQAQLQALDVSLDELQDARREVLKSELTIAEKQIELAKIEEKSLALEEEEAEAKKQRRKIEAQKHKIATAFSELGEAKEAIKVTEGWQLLIEQEKALIEQGQGRQERLQLYEFELLKASGGPEMQGAQQAIIDERQAKVDTLEQELKNLREEAKEKAGESAVASDIEKILAKARGGVGKFAEQRAAGGVAGLHDVPVGIGYGQHAQQLMTGEKWEEFDPTQTKGAKAMEAMFGETMPGLTSYSHTPGPIGAAGFGPGEEGAKRFNIYTSDAYKAAVAASEGGIDNIDDTLMAMQSVLSTGRFTAGSAITTDQRTGDKMFKYSELQAMKERGGGYSDKFLSHRGEKIMDNEQRRALGMDELVEDTYTKSKFGGIQTSDMWHQAMLDDDAMMAMGGPKLGQDKGGGRYLSSAAESGGLGLLNDQMLEYYGITMSAKDQIKSKSSVRTEQTRDAPGKKLSQTKTDEYKSDVGMAAISTSVGSGKTVGIFDRMVETEKEVVEGVGKDKTSVRKTSRTMAEVMFQTFKDGFFEIAAGVGEETKMVAGQIKTEDDIQNVLENLASLTGESVDSNVLSSLREQLELSLKTGAFGFEDLTKTGRIEQVGPHSDAWKVTKKGEELYAKSFGQGGRQKGIPGAAVGGTEEYRRSQFLAGMSPDAGELPRDLMLGEMAWGTPTEMHTEKIGPNRGGRGQEYRVKRQRFDDDRYDPTMYEGEGGTKPYMTIGDTTTYALPPSSGVQGTRLADPYANEARDAGGRMVNMPQYRPTGVSDMENYPDYYWQKYGEAGHDPSKLSGDEISKLQEEYKASDPMSTLTVGGIPGQDPADAKTQEVTAEATAETADATNILASAIQHSTPHMMVQLLDPEAGARSTTLGAETVDMATIEGRREFLEKATVEQWKTMFKTMAEQGNRFAIGGAGVLERGTKGEVAGAEEWNKDRLENIAKYTEMAKDMSADQARWLMRDKDATIEEAKAYAQELVVDWSSAEEKTEEGAKREAKIKALDYMFGITMSAQNKVTTDSASGTRFDTSQAGPRKGGKRKFFDYEEVASQYVKTMNSIGDVVMVLRNMTTTFDEATQKDMTAASSDLVTVPWEKWKGNEEKLRKQGMYTLEDINKNRELTKQTTYDDAAAAGLDETTQDEIKEADKTTAQVLTDVKVGAQSSLGVTLMDAGGKVLDWWTGTIAEPALDILTMRKMGGTSEHMDARGRAISQFGALGASKEESSKLKDYFGGMEWSANAALMTGPQNLPMDAILAGIYQYGQMAFGETFSGATGDASRNIQGSYAAIGEGRMTQMEMIQKSIQISNLPAERKRALLDAAAVASSGAGGGGGTSVVVNAPSTSNSNSTVQKIDANPLVSHNPRRPIGVHYG